MDSHQADIAQRLEAAKQRQQVWSGVMTDYLKAMMLLTEGARGTLLSLGMSGQDTMANIDQILQKMRAQSREHLRRAETQKAATLNGATMETKQ